ncbi:response regulator transcription factor [Marinimicrobium agarilyticum]|uniref:response regulator transcription factor n=1 Tax=Marinimicrobium agarilyticum TaxID=306546 RepID=UPI000688D37B|nr:response regulator transcription factor [Marinimicrobium agarilyticum]
MEPTPEGLPAARALWVGRDDDLHAVVRARFRTEGWSIASCRAGQEACDCVLRADMDILIVDADAPGLNPWSLLAELRQWQSTPVILLARDSNLCVDAFRRGADDFLTKPVNPAELLVRSEALLRRLNGATAMDAANDTLTLGPLMLSRSDRTVRYDERALRLTAIQFKLLWSLARHHNSLLHKADLHRWVLNKSYCRDDRSIDMHLSRIRKKLMIAGMPADAIQTVRGHGYRLSLLPPAGELMPRVERRSACP